MSSQIAHLISVDSSFALVQSASRGLLRFKKFVNGWGVVSSYSPKAGRGLQGLYEASEGLFGEGRECLN